MDLRSVASDHSASSKREFRLCLAASGGGHVRQLLDLEEVWERYDHFFVTEDTALGRSLAARHRVHFVDHYAVGQALLGHVGKMLRGCFANFFQSARIIFRERPDVIISTGSGAAFWVALFARALGARFVLIESFARFDSPSRFGRLAARFATHKVVQAPALQAYWPDAVLFDPLRMIEGERPPKKPLLFATVGATLPFDRLIGAVLSLKAKGGLSEHVLAQVGDGCSHTTDMADVEIVETLDFETVQLTLRDADLVVCHGGTGSLITALRAGCRVVAMPRRHDLGEHYDDHQQEITSAFAKRGLIEVADTVEELELAIARSRSRPPVMATTDPVGLIRHLNQLLGSWELQRS